MLFSSMNYIMIMFTHFFLYPGRLSRGLQPPFSRFIARADIHVVHHDSLVRTFSFRTERIATANLVQNESVMIHSKTHCQLFVLVDGFPNRYIAVHSNAVNCNYFDVLSMFFSFRASWIRRHDPRFKGILDIITWKSKTLSHRYAWILYIDILFLISVCASIFRVEEDNIQVRLLASDILWW